MSINILTSMFHNGFSKEFADYLCANVKTRKSFVFVASEFEKIHEKTDGYFEYFRGMFEACGIVYEHSCVVDSRMTKEDAKNVIAEADVVWLSGGDMPTQYKYWEEYELIDVLRARKGITIGMSAGAINMATLAICTRSCEHSEQTIYSALGRVPISVEPHIDEIGVTQEHLQLSQEYPIYGLCDEAVIIFEDDEVHYLGNVVLIDKGEITQISE